MTKNHLPDFWKLRLVGALLIIGVILISGGGYAFAQTPCLPGQPCVKVTPKWTPEPGNPRGLPPLQLERINKFNPQAIEQLQREDPQAIQKLKQGDRPTLIRLQQLAPNYQQQLEQSAPINQVR